MKKLYELTKYRGLSKVNKPLMIAYSAQVDKEVSKRANEVGFDECVRTPLSISMFNHLVEKNLDKFVRNQIVNEFNSIPIS
jgi:hypothetical protein